MSEGDIEFYVATTNLNYIGRGFTNGQATLCYANDSPNGPSSALGPAASSTKKIEFFAFGGEIEEVLNSTAFTFATSLRFNFFINTFASQFIGLQKYL